MHSTDSRNGLTFLAVFLTFGFNYLIQMDWDVL
jgi:hypothetical protein